MHRWFIAAVAITLFVRPSFAQSEWREYIYADQQFAASFPAAPAVNALPVRTPDGTAVNESRYTATLGAAHFQVSVFDLLPVRMNGATAVARAAYSLRAKGEVKLDAVAEVQGNWGRDLEIVAPDGNGTVAAIFFRNDRLYVIEAGAPAPDFETLSGDMIRFQQSLRFIGSPRLRRFGPDPARALQDVGGRFFGPGPN